MTENLSLFVEQDTESSVDDKTQRVSKQPLADRMRPSNWEDFQGLSQLDQNLVEQLRTGRGTPPSLVLWGPPGCGKTTLARLIGSAFDCKFVEFSAVLQGVKEVRDIVGRAKLARMRTMLFVDEIHRFNKAQQDAFLPHIEAGTIVLVGATTENPSFYLNNALLSRMTVLALSAIADNHLQVILQRALGNLDLTLSEEAQVLLCQSAGGDARRLLNVLEAFIQAYSAQLAGAGDVSIAQVQEFLKKSGSFVYDRSGDEHYNMVSAFIKSMRGSDPDAALYWGFRMLEGGEDPRFLIRRMIIFASEDVSNADPRALQLAVATLQAFEALGLPEGRIPIAQCISFLATAPKSNRSYRAMHAAVAAVREHAQVSVPLHLRNAPTQLMQDLGYAKEYAYPHNAEKGYVPGVQYFPDGVEPQIFYEPSNHGYEKSIKERLAYWRGEER